MRNLIILVLAVLSPGSLADQGREGEGAAWGKVRGGIDWQVDIVATTGYHWLPLATTGYQWPGKGGRGPVTLQCHGRPGWLALTELLLSSDWATSNRGNKSAWQAQVNFLSKKVKLKTNKIFMLTESQLKLLSLCFFLLLVLYIELNIHKAEALQSSQLLRK